MWNQVDQFKAAAGVGSGCEVVVPKMTYGEVLRGGGIKIELEEQFTTTNDLSNAALMLFVQYFPEQARRFKK